MVPGVRPFRAARDHVLAIDFGLVGVNAIAAYTPIPMGTEHHVAQQVVHSLLLAGECSFGGVREEDGVCSAQHGREGH